MPDPALTHPLPATTSGRWVVVSLPDHTIKVKQDGALIKEITSFATGRLGHLTPVLNDVPIDPNRRYTMHHSSAYNNAPMPWSLLFYGGCAFHEGDPAIESHGCVHLLGTDAKWLFDWVGKSTVHVQVQGPQRTGSHPGLGPHISAHTTDEESAGRYSGVPQT